MSELDKVKAEAVAAEAAGKAKVASLWARYWPVVVGVAVGALVAKVWL